MSAGAWRRVRVRARYRGGDDWRTIDRIPADDDPCVRKAFPAREGRLDEDVMSDFSDFQREIADAARATFRALRALHTDEHFYAFALYTDSGAMTVVPAANSVEGLRRMRTQQAIADDDPAPWCTWGFAEWAYAAAEASPFNALCGKLADEVLSPQFVQSRFAEFSRQLHTDMIEALRLLDRDGLFGTGEARAAITLFVSISDDDAADALENESAKALNPPAVADAFLRRYD
ncbi:DUF4303 domain-containing protein [Burkholderia metallica]|uniref:DUF4303 domain-containing protein n=1 Tax=Burkholderia metallica TaxID=488729 RepID=UPI001CF4A76E|nr:DUF4303 domain-containing protein [Burkholderia metallica]MCA8019809.1 DUF4303 domain-containing protein [Burkholderia metallica]